MATPRERTVYQMKATLMDTKPPIWRRLRVVSDASLSELHQVLQTAMGWSNSHLHQFIAKGEYYGEPSADLDVEVIDEAKVKLNQLLKKEKDSFAYEYDFGDSWQHKIVLEKVVPMEEGCKLPQCVAGKRACPPEDVGGTWGYEEFLEAIQNERHPQHAELRDWIGGDFDPEQFDPAGVNKALRAHRR